MQKGFVIPAVPLIMVVLILAVGGALYLNKSNISKVLPPATPFVKVTPSPTPDSIVNLKTYTNTIYRFSFVYPQNWNISITKPDDLGVSLSNIANGHTINIEVLRGTTGFGYCYRYGTEKKIIVAGKAARTTDGVGTGGTPMCEISKENMSKLGNTFVLIPLSDQSDPAHSAVIHIDYDYPLNDITFAKSNLNLILPTFKFSEETEGQFCGGIAGTECPTGYSCQLEGNYPDAGGKCVKL